MTCQNEKCGRDCGSMLHSIPFVNGKLCLICDMQKQIDELKSNNASIKLDGSAIKIEVAGSDAVVTISENAYTPLYEYIKSILENRDK